jgi:2-methylcitrate dehydratase PrpD
MSLTDDVIGLAVKKAGELPASAVALARLSLLDWLVCARAGRNEPVSAKLRRLAEAEAGRPVASLVGGGRAPSRMAALVNGTASHALDFDDTHFGHIGHLSVGIYPAAAAAGEEVQAPGDAIVEAFLVGAEAAIRIGIVLGAAHYNRGFHQTATAGAFGAAVAAGRLYGLSEAELRAAIGLCATRASGLKSQFGTMGKPYNAGLAASNGIEAALLARLGMNSADDGLSGAQGFVETHTDLAGEAPDANGFLFEDNKYKFHACCHGLHAMIEALLARPADIGIDDVASLRIVTANRWLRVCDIKRPRTGLEVKFSYCWLAGMVLQGVATGSDAAYVDSRASDPVLKGFAERVDVTGSADLTDTQVEVALTLKGGREVALRHDLMQRLPIDALAAKLEDKAIALLGRDGEPIIHAVKTLRSLSAAAIGDLLRG